MPVFLAIAESGTGEAFATARMRVLERFQGNPPDTFEAFADALCGGPAPEAGRVYLLYETDDFSKRVALSGCGRSQDVRYAKEDLDFWRAYVDGKTQTTIRGTLSRDLDRNAKDYAEAKKIRPMKEVPVLIRNAFREYRVKTNSRGEYRVVNAVPGEYTVLPTLKGYQVDWFGENGGSIATGGCMVRDFTMHVDRAVRGFVRDANGLPAAGLAVRMIPADQKAADQSEQFLYATTEADGSFAIERIRPGSYYVGVEIKEGQRVYYPGTADRRSASQVVFTRAPRSYTLDWRLPPHEE